MGVGRPRTCNVQVCEISINSCPVVRSLGVILDTPTSMSAHVRNICTPASFALWKIAKIRKRLYISISTEK